MERQNHLWFAVAWKYMTIQLVGGFNPFANTSQIGSFPQVGVKMKIVETTTQTIVSKQSPEIRNSYIDVNSRFHSPNVMTPTQTSQKNQGKSLKFMCILVHSHPQKKWVPSNDHCSVTEVQPIFPPTPCHSRARYILTVGSMPWMDGCCCFIWGNSHIRI